MIIKCEHCFYSNAEKPCSDKFSGFRNCSECEPAPEYKYRYKLAEALHLAVLERLFDPKNLVKGDFSKDLFLNFKRMREERDELGYEVHSFNGAKIKTKEQARRIIEECGDVAAYLAAIIAATEVKE